MAISGYTSFMAYYTSFSLGQKNPWKMRERKKIGRDGG